ncbi:hypothetical protein G7046_g4215 [Stylonectria norvegica]|nr:hypothetical protein G7046_g4215 [Stylonectria norvegica]
MKRHLGSEGSQGARIPPSAARSSTRGESTAEYTPKHGVPDVTFIWADIPKKDWWLFMDAGDILKTIRSTDISPSQTAVTSSSGYDMLCSYNWVNLQKPTVYVPGNPPHYVNMPLPMRLLRDEGIHFIDQNSFKLPKYPFEVVFRAIEIMSPSFKFDDVDVVINRNSLRKLLEFCLDKSQMSFRLVLHTIGNTLVVERCEENTVDMIIGPHSNSGFGHSFEQATTFAPAGMEDICGHHRVLRYSLGGLSCAVRFEVDASYDPEGEATLFEPRTTTMSGGDETELLAKALGTFKLDTKTSGGSAPSSQDEPKIEVILRGTAVSHHKMAEIKSLKMFKSSKRPMAQLWFGRTPFLIQGLHQDGVFSKIQISNAGSDFKRWETEDRNQAALRKVASLLDQLRAVVKETKGNSCIAIYTRGVQPKEIRIFGMRESQQPLPKDVIERFWEGAGGSSF